MRSVILGCFLAAFVWMPTSLFAAELSAEQVAQRIQRQYENTDDFKAVFSQKYHSEAFGQTKESSGFVYVKKPGKMRWDYVKPRAKHFVADGKSLYIYDPDLEQVMVSRSFSGSDLSTAVTFLWGKGSLIRDFNISFSKKADLQSAGHYVLQLLPKEKARFKRLWFVVEQEGFRVVKTVIEDPGGNINQISFSKMSTNVGLQDNAFQFTIPEGIEVIEAPGS